MKRRMALAVMMHFIGLTVILNIMAAEKLSFLGGITAAAVLALLVTAFLGAGVKRNAEQTK